MEWLAKDLDSFGDELSSNIAASDLIAGSFDLAEEVLQFYYPEPEYVSEYTAAFTEYSNETFGEQWLTIEVTKRKAVDEPSSSKRARRSRGKIDTDEDSATSGEDVSANEDDDYWPSGDDDQALDEVIGDDERDPWQACFANCAIDGEQ